METALSIAGLIVGLIVLATCRHYLGYWWWRHKHPKEYFTYGEYTCVIAVFENTESIYGNALAPYINRISTSATLLRDVKRTVDDRYPKVKSICDVGEEITADIKDECIKLMTEAVLFFRSDLEDDIKQDPETGEWKFKYLNPQRRASIIRMGSVNLVYICASMAADLLEWEKNGCKGDWLFSEFTSSVIQKLREDRETLSRLDL